LEDNILADSERGSEENVTVEDDVWVISWGWDSSGSDESSSRIKVNGSKEFESAWSVEDDDGAESSLSKEADGVRRRTAESDVWSTEGDEWRDDGRGSGELNDTSGENH
jgi:hypothetical protein